MGDNKEVVDKEDEVLEGEYQTPQIKQKVFQTVDELCGFLNWTKHSKIKVETQRSVSGFVYLLQWEVN